MISAVWMLQCEWFWCSFLLFALQFCIWWTERSVKIEYKLPNKERENHAFSLVIITLYIHKLHSFRHWYFPITFWTVVFGTDSLFLYNRVLCCCFHRFNCVSVLLQRQLCPSNSLFFSYFSLSSNCQFEMLNLIHNFYSNTHMVLITLQAISLNRSEPRFFFIQTLYSLSISTPRDCFLLF